MINYSKINDLIKVVNILDKEVINYDVPFVEFIKIQTKDKFKVLLSTILSARTKDEVTAKVAKKLFQKIKNYDDLIHINEKELEQLLYPIGFYRTKAKNLKKLGYMMVNDFDYKIPKTIEELILLPGVGRKTANLVMSAAHNLPGLCVDTHVHRICNRIGFIKTKTPYETEMDLRSNVPEKYWSKINRVFVPFGQKICTPSSPHCSQCKIYKLCNRINVKNKR